MSKGKVEGQFYFTSYHLFIESHCRLAGFLMLEARVESVRVMVRVRG